MWPFRHRGTRRRRPNCGTRRRTPFVLPRPRGACSWTPPMKRASSSTRYLETKRRACRRRRPGGGDETTPYSI
ncbi:unnamed protein product [Ectocarpus sp. 4 AP-2014]